MILHYSGGLILLVPRKNWITLLSGCSGGWYHWPEGNSSKREWEGCEGSKVILLAKIPLSSTDCLLYNVWFGSWIKPDSPGPTTPLPGPTSPFPRPNYSSTSSNSPSSKHFLSMYVSLCCSVLFWTKPIQRVPYWAWPCMEILGIIH